MMMLTAPQPGDWWWFAMQCAYYPFLVLLTALCWLVRLLIVAWFPVALGGVVWLSWLGWTLWRDVRANPPA